MADFQCDKHIKKRKELSFGSSSLSISSNAICSNVDEQFELSWPAADERDSSQIQKEDPTPQYPEGSIRHCPEIKRVHQKILHVCPEDNKILFHDLSQSSLNEKVSDNEREIIGQLSTIDQNISDESPKINYWDFLSDEIILAIFAFLTRKNVIVCTKVCKRWHRLAYDETLWYSMDLTGSSFSENVLTRLLMRGVVVLRLAWAEVLHSLVDESLETLKDSRSQDLNYSLQYMDASTCDINEDSLSQSITKSTNLKNLSLEACSLSTGLLRSIASCHQLAVLNLCMCSNITKIGLSVLTKGCSRITELNLSWTNLTQEAISEVKDFPLLVKLDLSGCRETLRDEAVVDLVATCNNLKTLDLSDCIVITQFCMKVIVEHGKMEQLSLSRCYGITPKSLELLTSLKTLQTLQIFGLLTNSGLSSLKKCLPSVDINGIMFTNIARPTETQYKKRIWGMKCKGHGT